MQPVTDAYRQTQGDEDEVSQVDVCETGGIDIDKARSRLLKEDLFDKKLYREKVQLKHRVSHAEPSLFLTKIMIFCRSVTIVACAKTVIASAVN